MYKLFLTAMILFAIIPVVFVNPGIGAEDNPKEAAPWIKRLEEKPQDTKAMEKLSDIFIQSGSYDKAGEILERWVKADGQNSRARYNLAMVYQIKGVLDRAEEQFLAALELDPRDPDVHFNLGNIYFKTGSFGKAAEQYLMTIQINPKYKDAYYNLASAYDKADQYELASKAYEQVLNLDPSDKVSRARMEELKGIIEPAKSVLNPEESVSAAPVPEQPKVNNSGRKEESEISAPINRNIKPDHETAWDASRVTQERPREEPLLTDSKPWIEEDKEEWSKMNRAPVSGLREEIRSAQGQKKQDWSYYHTEGDKYFSQGDYEKALASYERALEIRDSDEVKVKTGQCLVKANLNADAVRIFEEVIKRSPGYKEAYYLLGRSYLIDSKFDDARRIHERLKSIDPDEAGKLYSLIVLEESAKQGGVPPSR